MKNSNKFVYICDNDKNYAVITSVKIDKENDSLIIVYCGYCEYYKDKFRGTLYLTNRIGCVMGEGVSCFESAKDGDRLISSVIAESSIEDDHLVIRGSMAEWLSSKHEQIDYIKIRIAVPLTEEIKANLI